MKNLNLRLMLLLVGTLLTLGLSHQAARAAGCANIEAGGTVYGDYDYSMEPASRRSIPTTRA